MTESANRESGLDLFAVLLAGALLFWIAAAIFILVAPHAPGGWRTVTASATVGAVLRLNRRLPRGGLREAGEPRDDTHHPFHHGELCPMLQLVLLRRQKHFESAH